MDVKFTPQLSITLTEGSLPIGTARIQILAGGVDLLSENPLPQSHILGNELICSLPVSQAGSLFLEVQANQPSVDQVTLAFTLTNTGATDLVLDGLKLPLLELEFPAVCPSKPPVDPARGSRWLGPGFCS